MATHKFCNNKVKTGIVQNCGQYHNKLPLFVETHQYDVISKQVGSTSVVFVYVTHEISLGHVSP